ncbi:hypothetical protein JCM5353_001686 [Sporobolomyces roseus]
MFGRSTSTSTRLVLHCLLAFLPLLTFATTSPTSGLSTSGVSSFTSQPSLLGATALTLKNSTVKYGIRNSEGESLSRFRIISTKGARGFSIVVEAPKIQRSVGTSGTTVLSTDQALPQIATALPPNVNAVDTPSMPGQSLSVFPLGLGIVGGFVLIGLAVFAYMTVQRCRYRELFRERSRQQEVQAKEGDQTKSEGTL